MKKYYKYLTIGILGLLILTLLCIDIALHICNKVITDQNIVVTFVGILASIIVIGNLAQVSVIKSDFDRETEKIKREQEKNNDTLKGLTQIVTDILNEYDKRENN